MSLSVCLLTLNEADRLPATLEPFLPLLADGRVGELLAYDSHSTDATVLLLKKAGATVLEGPWLGFSATRRALWSAARGDWILWLDADEVFPAETLAALTRALENPAPSVGGYRICRQVVFAGQRVRHGDWSRDRVLRVFRKDAYTMAERAVHESVKVPGRVVDLPGFVEHHSFRSWDDLRARSERYAELWARQALAEGRRGGSPSAHALGRFLRGYFVKSGWLDGALGFKIALHNAGEVHAKYQQLNRLRLGLAEARRAHVRANHNGGVGGVEGI